MSHESTTHLLTVPAGVGVPDLRELLGEHFPAALNPGSAMPPLRLADDVYAYGPEGGPDGTTQWRFVTTPRRGEAPDPGVPDPDGLYLLFSEGLPEDEELRLVEVLLGLARRVHGRVVVDATDPGGGTEVEPDPDIRIDLTVWSRHLLSPEQVIGLVYDVEPNAQMPPLDKSFLGLAPEPADGADLTESERADIHREAWRMDAAALGSDDVDLARFGVVIPLASPGDLIAIEIHPTEDLHPTTADLPTSVRAHFGVADRVAGGEVAAGEPASLDDLICYDVRWEPADDEALYTDEPGSVLLVLRSQAQQRIQAVAAALAPALEAVVTNADGYPIGLRDR